MAPRTHRQFPHRRPATAAFAALAAGALAIPLLSGCGAVSKAMDCANTANAIVDSVGKLQQAVGSSLDNPQEAKQALDAIDRNLDKVGKSTDDPELSKAINKMNTGVKDARKDIDNAQAPDLKPISDAAGDMTKICTPG
ncbi:hypothetical protein FCH28_12195 [Streptomyces piniterrae]|uniref:Secreted protein n=1 Tax=Streptomyces piniterrae TaxID=2571125 RepID=A0A4U0P029_9ACTN|nr:hypothetical protein [Streptomyces piniterrae]TJZ56014.1 hypothetical protein FCH28_12195 [Streptomyces piniterrae]